MKILVFWQVIYIYDASCEPKLDGRPMSGDIGRGATREAIAFAVRLAAAEDRPQGLYTREACFFYKQCTKKMFCCGWTRWWGTIIIDKGLIRIKRESFVSIRKLIWIIQNQSQFALWTETKLSFHVGGFLQLAGGTNAHTVDGLKREGLFQVATIPSG